MTHNDDRTADELAALVVPADASRLCYVEWIDDADCSSKLRAIVGDPVERAGYDRDVVLWLNGEGANTGLARNERATAYAFRDSEAAARKGSIGAYPYWLYGDVVVMGWDVAADAHCRVPARLWSLFGVAAPSQS